MNKRVAIIISMALLVGPAVASAQGITKRARPSSFAGAARAVDLSGLAPSKGFSLLDPSRLHFNQSYSMSYFSGSGRTGSIGVYMSTLEYQFSRPLSVRIGLGYLHQPLGFLNNSGGANGGQFLPSFQIDWRPSDNMRLIFDYRTTPGAWNGAQYGRDTYAPYSGSLSPLWDW